MSSDSGRGALVLDWARTGSMHVVLVGCLAGPCLLAAIRGQQVFLSVFDATMLLHVTLLVTLLGMPFTLADPCSQLLASLPHSFTRIRAERALAASALVMASWGLQLALIPAIITSHQEYQGQYLAIEVIPFLLLALALSWHVAPGGAGTTRTLGGLIALYLLCWFSAPAFTLFANPSDTHFAASRWNWVVLTLITALALALVIWPRSHRVFRNVWVRLRRPAGR